MRFAIGVLMFVGAFLLLINTTGPLAWEVALVVVGCLGVPTMMSQF